MKKGQRFISKKANSKAAEHLVVEFNETEIDRLLDLVNLCRDREVEYEILVV